VIVDDNSADGTGVLAEDISNRFPGKILVIHRGKKAGLSSAIMDGFKAASNDLVGVTDADMSHDIEKIPQLIKPIAKGETKLCIGSRYNAGGNIRNWSLKRKIISKGAIMLARPLTRASDPVSGFFFLDRKIILGAKLDLEGYKLLLEILVKGKYSGAVEVPYSFVNRTRGKSKLNGLEMYYYLKTLSRLYAYRLLK
jgi:dolichol-phosphate mannosyltransferase